MAPTSYAMDTSGANEPVWLHTEPYSNRPQFKKLDRDIEVDACVIGAGIAGISTAYELVTRGVSVAMIEARQVLSGESGRTSGHLSNSMDENYPDIAKTHGQKGAKIISESHTWALEHVGEVAKKLDFECEYRVLPDYEISQFDKGTKEHDEEVQEIKDDVKMANELGIPATFVEGLAIRGWDGKVDQRDAGVYERNATFHPTKYLVGVLKWLAQQPNFQCYTHTRMISVEEKGPLPGPLSGLMAKEVHVGTLDGHTITCKNAVEATCVPLQKLSIVTQVEFFRTYCIAIRVPKGSIEDCLINDQADPYHYIRFTACDEKDDYLVIGGGDHKVGQEPENGRYAELEKWVRERFTRAGNVDYKWSGQIFDSVDMVQFIGLNQGNSHTYVVTGDSGHGLTSGVIAGKLITDEIMGERHPWSELYNPKRLPKPSIIPSMIGHDLQINAQYKRFVQSDIKDIEDLGRGEGGVLNPPGGKPIAIYKDEEGRVSKFSALCPHLKGVVCWNSDEKSFDCPVHGSRFSKEGICVIGPSKVGLGPEDGSGEVKQQEAITA